MRGAGPRILLIGGTYRALCVLERLLERGDRVVAFIGVEGGGERDFCPEILEICDRASIPARSGHKLGEEIVRWLEDRIRPELAIALGVGTEIPLAVGGNCRLGLVEVADLLCSDSCTGVALRQRGRELVERRIESSDDEDAGELYLRVIDELTSCVEEYLDQLAPSFSEPRPSVPFATDVGAVDDVAQIARRPHPGKATRRLERAAADYLGARHVFALDSARHAFACIAQVLGLGADDEVIVPGLVSAAAVDGLAPAKLVRADVDADCLTLDPERACEAIGSRTRALVVSHALGQPAALDRLYPLAEERELEVIEDGGESLGARFGDSRLGRSPCACVFRLPLGAGAAPAAALVTLPDGLAERFAPLAAELRLGDGAAELGLRALESCDDRIAARRAIASDYSAELVRYDAFRVPATPQDALPVHAGYLLRLTRFARASADDLHKLLLESGIETRRLRLPIADRQLAALPCADGAASTGLLLPVRPDLGNTERERLLDAIFGYAIG